MYITFQEVIIRLLVSALLGSVVGLERERLNWVAGLRTHMLVCVGSTLIMMVSMHGFGDVMGKENVVLDPSRVAAQVVSGIGFLGAGTIFFWRREILRGLTTAAALWAVAGIGLAIGGGMYSAGVAATILVLIILAFLKPVERLISKNVELSKHILRIKIHPKKISLESVEQTLTDAGIKLVEMEVRKVAVSESSQEYLLEINIVGSGEKLLRLADELKNNDGVQSIVYQ